jgi:hypothetical protein
MASKQDVGMAVKMNTVGFPGYFALSRGESIEESAIWERCDYVDQRHDCADFRLIVLIQTFIAYGDTLSEASIARIRATMKSFKYWMDEPGEDGMCFWSENHQLLFATCEYFAGILLEDEVFDNSKMTGSEHRQKALKVLYDWFHLRFDRGFIEWHSNTYYEEDIAPLCVLVDFALDEDLAAMAAIALDLLMLDFAHHSFQGRFHASSGRCYELPKKDSTKMPVQPILRHAFDELPPLEETELSLSALFVTCRNYVVPKAIRAIWSDREDVLVRESSGYDLKDVKALFPDATVEERGRLFWAMEAFTNVESIDTTVELFLKWKLHTNVFLKDLNMIAKPWLLKAGLLPLLVRILNPATQGVAIQKADVITYRTKHYQLSSVQRHHPGEFADQQHVWHACLPKGVNLFSTHPGSPMFDDSARNFSPSYWVGNGIFPDALQIKNRLLLIYDTTSRKGFLERKRQHLVHFYVPFQKCDEIVSLPRAFYVRVGESYAAILSSHMIETADDEWIVRAKQCAFVVILGSKEEDGSFEAFQGAHDPSRLSYQRRTLRYGNDSLAYKRIGNDSAAFPRFESPYAKRLNDGRLFLECNGETWILDVQTLERKEFFQ